MRILHTADLHLGARFKMLGKLKGDAQRAQLVKTFERIAELAVDEKADVFIVAGDLFDSNTPSARSVDAVRAIFAKLSGAGVRVFVIPGTHDCYEKASVWRSIDLADGQRRVRVFTDETEPVVIDELGLTVHGLVFASKKAPADALRRLRRTTNTPVHVGIVHGSLELPGIVDETGNEDLVFTQEDASATGMNYLALGHWHSFREERFGDVIACYPGAPELVSVDQRGAGGVALVEIDDGGKVRVEPKSVGARRFESLEIPIDTVTSAGEIMDRIRANADPNLVLEVALTGLCSFDLEIDEEDVTAELADAFFHLRVRDRSHPRLDDVRIGELPAATVAGRFAHLMAERAEKAAEAERLVYEEALRLGVALLEGRRVLG